MILVVDHRERGRKHAFPESFDCFTRILPRVLDLGDYAVLETEESTHPMILVEYKTLSDLDRSILDGRYHEQKLRLAAFRDETAARVAFIIEYDLREILPRVFTALVHLQTQHGFLVFSSRGARDTLGILCALVREHRRRCSCEPPPSSAVLAPRVSYKKNANTTREQYFIHCVSGLPGISSHTAASLCMEFHASLEAFTEAVRTLPFLVVPYGSAAAANKKARRMRTDRWRGLLSFDDRESSSSSLPAPHRETECSVSNDSLDPQRAPG